MSDKRLAHSSRFHSALGALLILRSLRSSGASYVSDGTLATPSTITNKLSNYISAHLSQY